MDFELNGSEPSAVSESTRASAAKNQADRQHVVFDSYDYMQYHSGMIANVRDLTGPNPRREGRPG